MALPTKEAEALSTSLCSRLSKGVVSRLKRSHTWTA